MQELAIDKDLRSNNRVQIIALDVDCVESNLVCHSQHDLQTLFVGVRQAVIVVHGTERSARRSFATLRKAAKIAVGRPRDVLIVAPQFHVRRDARANRVPARVPVWRAQGWKQGDPSTDLPGHPPGISSFAVLDALVAHIAGIGGATLKTITVTGHSAGAQMVQRYAAGTRLPDVLLARGIAMRFIVANPSSYLYLNADRPASGSTPEALARSCRPYNRYKYGLTALNPYLADVGAEAIREQYPRRDVTYLLGALDCLPGMRDLDESCAAALQGAHRLARAKAFMEHMHVIYGSRIAARHRLVVVPEVGHDSRSIYCSADGVAAVFDVSDPAAP